MIYIPRWKIALVIATCLIGILYALPNVLSKDTQAWMSASLPEWMPHNTVNLGLDLQGGSHLLLEVDLASVIKDRSDSLVQGIRPDLRDAKIGYTQIAVIPEGGIRIKLRDAGDASKVRKSLRTLDSDLDVADKDNGATLEATYGAAALKKISDKTIEQSIEIIRRRVDETGTREPAIQRQGDNRIILQIPGLDNPERIKELLGRTAKLTFHLVGDTGGGRSLPLQDHPGQNITIQRQWMLTGDMLTDAQPGFGQGGNPVVTFRLNGMGTKRFCDVTRDNVSKPFAIVLDGTVISAPTINEPFCGGSAQISGNFTLQEATDLSLLLRAGALPAPLHVVEERTVGPTLGADSVKAGMKACIYAFVFVFLYMSLIYGLFGIFASFALLFNMILIIAVMSTLQAILTLPGIAGIVLTIGLAVDANVLIFERIKEELRAGRSIVSALDTGYTRARTTIIDSNLTALIAAIILFSFGTGPIKGFAVTMCIGVVTSYFCALMLTQLIILSWVRWKKPKTIAA